MDEGSVLEVPGTNVAILVMELNYGFELAERPAVHLPSGVEAIPYMTHLDLASEHLRDQGYVFVKAVVVGSNVFEFFEKKVAA